MRRLLDPLELEKLAHHHDDPLQSPLDLMREFCSALVALFVVAVFSVAGVAFALSELPGVSP